MQEAKEQKSTPEKASEACTAVAERMSNKRSGSQSPDEHAPKRTKNSPDLKVQMSLAKLNLLIKEAEDYLRAEGENMDDGPVVSYDQKIRINNSTRELELVRATITPCEWDNDDEPEEFIEGLENMFAEIKAGIPEDLSRVNQNTERSTYNGIFYHQDYIYFNETKLENLGIFQQSDDRVDNGGAKRKLVWSTLKDLCAPDGSIYDYAVPDDSNDPRDLTFRVGFCVVVEGHAVGIETCGVVWS